MIKNIFKITFLLITLLFSVRTVKAEEVSVYPVRVHVFYLKTCPHCHDEIEYLDKIKKKYPLLEVYTYEVSDSVKNQSLKDNVGKHYSVPAKEQQYVPLSVIGDDYHVGYDNDKITGADLEKKIQACSVKGCDSWLDEMLGMEPISKEGKATVDMDQSLLPDLPEADIIRQEDHDQPVVRIFGQRWEIGKDMSIWLLGVVLGLADGVNPCMFSVIIFLMTYLLAIGSKRRAVKAGIAFIITTFVVYFLFMFGILKVVDIFQVAGPVRMVVTLFALVAGLIMVKDFFFYGKGVSLDIPERFKPKIEALVKQGTLPSAILLALFSSIVELPCTSGLPLAYAAILSKSGANPIGYLVWYNIFFVVPLIVLVGLVIFAWTKVENIEAWRQQSKKYMRLVAGVILLFLAWALWNNYL